MKTFYCDGIITFTDNSEKVPWKGKEIFEFLIRHTNKKEAKKQAKEKARKYFDDEYNCNYDDIEVIIENFYLTDDLAML